MNRLRALSLFGGTALSLSACGGGSMSTSTTTPNSGVTPSPVPSPTPTANPQLGLFIPAYAMWELAHADYARLLATQPTASGLAYPRVIVIDEGFWYQSNPTPSFNRGAYDEARAAGWTILTYIPTNFGTGATRTFGGVRVGSTLTALQALVDTAYALSPQADGIFFDEGVPDNGNAGAGGTLSTFYTQLASYARAAGSRAGRTGLVAVNTGVPPSYQAIVDAVDIVLSVELDATTYLAHLARSRPQSGVTLPRVKAAHVVHGWNSTTQPIASFTNGIARADGAGYLFVNTGSSQYDHLPSVADWATETIALSTANGGG